MHFHLRVAGTDKYPNLFNEVDLYLAKHFISYFVFEEIGKREREHIHCYVYSEMTESGFRNKFRKAFSLLKGKEDHDYFLAVIKEQDVRNVQRYICKGYKPITEGRSEHKFIGSSVTWTRQQLLQLQEEFWEENKRQQSEKQKAEKEKEEKIKEESDKKEPFIKKVLKSLLSDRPMGQWDRKSEHDRVIVFKRITRMLGELYKFMDAFIISRYINGVWHHLDNRGNDEYLWYLIEHREMGDR